MAISLVSRGGTPTLLEEWKANELINKINELDDTAENLDERVTALENEEAEEGLPEGFSEEILGVVQNNNTAGQRVFLTRAVATE
jgi:coenzyme F420-reducing hydrogenase alpha subunit